MHHTFIVTVETDDTHLDASSAQDISNEIQSNLEFDGVGPHHPYGILSVAIRSITHNYKLAVERSHEV